MSLSFLYLQTVALARPTAESNPPVQRIVTNSIPMTTMTPGPISVSNSVPTPLVTSPLRPVSNINPSTQSKLTGSNGLSTIKTCGFGQNTSVQATQEGCQDKQIEQAKLVSFLRVFIVFYCFFFNLLKLSSIGTVIRLILFCFGSGHCYVIYFLC